MIRGGFKVSSLHHINEEAGILLKFLDILRLLKPILDEILISFKTQRNTSFGFYYQQFVYWFAKQIQFEWPPKGKY